MSLKSLWDFYLPVLRVPEVKIKDYSVIHTSKSKQVTKMNGHLQEVICDLEKTLVYS